MCQSSEERGNGEEIVVVFDVRIPSPGSPNVEDLAGYCEP